MILAKTAARGRSSTSVVISFGDRPLFQQLAGNDTWLGAKRGVMDGEAYAFLTGDLIRDASDVGRLRLSAKRMAFGGQGRHHGLGAAAWGKVSVGVSIIIGVFLLCFLLSLFDSECRIWT